MSELQRYERPQMEVVDLDREDAILTSNGPACGGYNCHELNWSPQ